jgi:hypothetical protein
MKTYMQTVFIISASSWPYHFRHISPAVCIYIFSIDTIVCRYIKRYLYTVYVIWAQDNISEKHLFYTILFHTSLFNISIQQIFYSEHTVKCELQRSYVSISVWLHCFLGYSVTNQVKLFICIKQNLLV